MKKRKRSTKKKKNNWRKKIRRNFRANDQMVSYNTNWKIPFPQRMRIAVTASCKGYWSDEGTLYPTMSCFFNKCYLPFNTSSPFQNIQGIYTSAQINPLGLTSLLNANTYTRYRVYASKISLRVTPTVASDAVDVIIYPYPGVPVNTTTLQQVIGLPYSKQKVFTISTDTPLTVYATTSDVSGYKKEAIQLDTANQLTGDLAAGPSQYWTWGVTMQQQETQGALNNRLGFTAEVTYYVELYELNYAGLFRA